MYYVLVLIISTIFSFLTLLILSSLSFVLCFSLSIYLLFKLSKDVLDITKWIALLMIKSLILKSESTTLIVHIVLIYLKCKFILVSPVRSYILLFSESFNISYALIIYQYLEAAALSLFLSGCHFNESSLNAFFIYCQEAFFETPKVWYGFDVETPINKMNIINKNLMYNLIIIILILFLRELLIIEKQNFFVIKNEKNYYVQIFIKYEFIDYQNTIEYSLLVLSIQTIHYVILVQKVQNINIFKQSNNLKVQTQTINSKSILYICYNNQLIIFSKTYIYMNVDFALYTPPRVQYDPISLWGEVIFIPKKEETAKSKQKYSSFFNCYRVNRQSEITLSLEAARLETYGVPISELQQNSTKESDYTEYEIKYNIPCLYLNSMVKSRYIILYFHASGEDIKLCYGLLNHLRNLYQINIIAMEYPGYSIYKGTPKAQRINQDAQYVYTYIINQLGFSQQNIIVMGRSIGTGTAIHLSAIKNPGALVLISAFISVKSLSKDFIGGWSSLFIKEQFDNFQNIKKTKSPIFFLHGKADSLISYHNTVELAKNCKQKNVVYLSQKMTHSKFDYYEDLSNPLRQFLISQLEMNLYSQQMKGPEIPSILFKNPLLM